MCSSSGEGLQSQCQFHYGRQHAPNNKTIIVIIITVVTVLLLFNLRATLFTDKQTIDCSLSHFLYSLCFFYSPLPPPWFVLASTHCFQGDALVWRPLREVGNQGLEVTGLTAHSQLGIYIYTLQSQQINIANLTKILYFLKKWKTIPFDCSSRNFC